MHFSKSPVGPVAAEGADASHKGDHKLSRASVASAALSTIMPNSAKLFGYKFWLPT